MLRHVLLAACLVALAASGSLAQDPPDQAVPISGLGPHGSLKATQGRVMEWTYEASGSQHLNGGRDGSIAANVNPRIFLGMPGAPQNGFIPAGTIVNVGATYLLSSSSACCPSNAGVVLIDSAVDLVKFSLGDAAHPGKIRIQYVSDATGATVQADWTTCADGERAFLDLEYAVRGNGGGGASRVLDVTLTKNGLDPKVVTGIRYPESAALTDGLPSSYDPGNAHHLLAAAGRIAYPL